MILSGKQFIGCVLAGAVLGLGMVVTHTGPGLARAEAANTARTRNTVRQSDLNLLATALTKYKADHPSTPITLPGTDTPICTSTGQNCLLKHFADLSFLTTAGDYIDAIPVDPGPATGLWMSGYTISQLSDGSIRLTAPRAELGATITVIR